MDFSGTLNWGDIVAQITLNGQTKDSTLGPVIN